MSSKARRITRNAALPVAAGIVMAALVLGGYSLGRRTNAPSTNDYWAAAVRGASGGKASLDRVFRGPDGLVGLVVEGKTSHTKQIAWGIHGHKIALVTLGPLFTSTGENASTLAYRAEVGPLPKSGANRFGTRNQAAIPAKPQARANRVEASKASAGADPPSQGVVLTSDQVYQGVSAAAAVAFGASHPKQTLYAMIDANCPYCNNLYGRLMARSAKLKAARISVHWIPVAILSGTSPGKGAALLRGGHAALTKNEHGYDLATEQGGITPIEDKTLEHEVYANTALMAHDGKGIATPTLIWRDGNKVHVEVGEPTPAVLSKILKTLAQSKSNAD